MPEREDSSGGRVLLVAILALAGVSLVGGHVYGLAPGLLLRVGFYDLLAGGYLAAALWSIQRPGPTSAAVTILLPAGLLLASWTKLAILGASARVEDANLLVDLARTLPAWQVAGAAILGVALALSLLLNLRLRLRPWVPAIPVLLVVALGAAAAFSPAFSGRIAAQLPLNAVAFPIWGHFTHAVTELFREIDHRHHEATILAEAGEAPPAPLRIAAIAARNVHVIMVESFLDPTWFRAIRWPQEPLSPLFAQWRAEGGSTALVPVLGSRSSNTEFEVLCGVPAAVGPSELAFMRIPADRRLDCLPRILRGAGFATLSVVPSAPRFFEAQRAFLALGFETSVFSDTLDMADLDGEWLSAEATLAQLRDRWTQLRRGLRPGQPMLAYTFVNAGHFPYLRDERRRPERFGEVPVDALTRAWANGAHYNALAVEAHVAWIRATDPDALVIVAGDHLPALGPDYRGFRAGGFLDGADPRPPEQRARMYETPLLILDRGRFVRAGRVPAWQLPGLILDLLTDGTACAASACPHREAWRVRPFRDMALLVEGQGERDLLCDERDGPSAAPACPPVLAEARRLQAAMLRMIRPQPR